MKEERKYNEEEVEEIIDIINSCGSLMALDPVEVVSLEERERAPKAIDRDLKRMEKYNAFFEEEIQELEEIREEYEKIEDSLIPFLYRKDGKLKLKLGR